MKEYEKTFIAHRGFFNNKDIPENSIKAFKRAVENGYGIELDTQITKDDKIVVFHDGNLKRMTGVDRMLIDCTYEELQQYRLLDTDERIPLFTDVLKVLHKDTPLIVEIKSEGRYILNTKMTVAILRNYDGLYNIESFHPMVPYYLKKNEPDIIRGQLSFNSLNYTEGNTPLYQRFICTFLLMCFLNKPDYIAYDVNSVDNISFRIISRLYKAKCVAWTVKSEEQYQKIKDYYDVFIFDSYVPKQ
ncbi:MAG: glycerophosphodiester phosphodiesterase family protein [Erysipelotrichaceae bacterium]|nr:glycerophosphodiester phosphodiesterase family protein [Erysipelotrichaceae bacterium]